MASAPKPAAPYRSVDIHGRALPMTEEEILERNAEAIRALDGGFRWFSYEPALGSRKMTRAVAWLEGV